MLPPRNMFRTVWDRKRSLDVVQFSRYSNSNNNLDQSRRFDSLTRSILIHSTRLTHSFHSRSLVSARRSPNTKNEKLHRNQTKLQSVHHLFLQKAERNDSKQSKAQQSKAMEDIEKVAKAIEDGKAKNILVLCGAGVSTGTYCSIVGFAPSTVCVRSLKIGCFFSSRAVLLLKEACWHHWNRSIHIAH